MLQSLIVLLLGSFLSVTAYANSCEEKLSIIRRPVERLDGLEGWRYRFVATSVPRVELETVREWMPFLELVKLRGEDELTMARQLGWLGRIENLRSRKVRILYLRFVEALRPEAEHANRIFQDQPMQERFAEDFLRRRRLLQAAFRQQRRRFNVIHFSWSSDALDWRDLEDSANSSRDQQPQIDETWIAHQLASRGWGRNHVTFLHFPEATRTPRDGEFIRHPIENVHKLDWGAEAMFFLNHDH